MNSAEIIGYGFEGCEYHVDCLTDDIRKEMNKDCTCESHDSNGLCDSNCNGYGPNPIFAGDEADGYCDICMAPIAED